jgi:hypothetical protein
MIQLNQEDMFGEDPGGFENESTVLTLVGVMMMIPVILIVGFFVIHSLYNWIVRMW